MNHLQNKHTNKDSGDQLELACPLLRLCRPVFYKRDTKNESEKNQNTTDKS